MKWGGIRTILVLCLWGCSYVSFPQSRLSPKFYNAGGRMGNKTMLFSVTVYDTAKFLQLYKDTIKTLHYYSQSNAFSLQASVELALQNFSIDSNIVFVDIIDSPTAE